MTEYGGLRQEIATRADAADADPERAAGLKSLAAQLWANFDEFTVEELEDTDGRDPGGGDQPRACGREQIPLS